MIEKKMSYCNSQWSNAALVRNEIFLALRRNQAEDAARIEQLLTGNWLKFLNILKNAVSGRNIHVFD